MRTLRNRIVLATVLPLAIGACGTAGSPETTPTSEASISTVPTTSQITTTSTIAATTPPTTEPQPVVGADFDVILDSNHFLPGQMITDAGAEVTFRLENLAPAGAFGSTHDFVVLSEFFDDESDYRDRLESEPSIELLDSERMSPGDTLDLTYTFESPGTYQIICSISGHLDAGMEATISVEG